MDDTLPPLPEGAVMGGTPPLPAGATTGEKKLSPKTLRQEATRAAFQPPPEVTGAVRGFFGGLGELEKFGAYTLPEIFGGRPAGTSDKLLGRETIFPTTEEVGKVLEKVGVKDEPSLRRTGGEIIGGFGTALPGIARGGSALFESGLSRLLRGKKTAEAQAKLGQEAASAAQAAESAIAKQSAAEAQRLARSAEQRAAAQRTAAKEGRRGETILRDLVGVRTAQEAGRYRPIPAGKTEIGDTIRKEADKFVRSIKEARNAKADQLFGQASGEARAYAQLGQFVDTKPIINQIDVLISKGGTQDYLTSLRRLREDIQRTRNFEGLEVIRRKLGDAAFGAPEEGYKAISQQFAGDMRDVLTTAMRDFSKKIGGKAEGAFGKYLDEYKRLSENLRVYGTKTGRGILETEGMGGQYLAKTSEKIADEMFSSPENYRKFVDAVGGNKQITEASARRYFANLLEGKTKPQEVEKVLKDYRDVLKEMPTVRTEIEGRYLAPLRRAVGRGEAAESLVKQTQQLDKEIAVRLKNVEGSGTLVSDAIKSLTNAKPGKSVEVFDNTVLPKLRDAEAKAGTKLFSDFQINALRQQVSELDRIADKTQKARIIGGLIGTYLVGQAGLKAGTTILGD